MHDEVRTFLMGVCAVARMPRDLVIEFGSLNVNGTARDEIPATSWWGIDLVSGPGVNEVANAATWDGWEGVKIDTVVCTEVLEHTVSGELICKNANSLLERDGLFIVTCAGPGRTAHGAHGEPHPAEDEYYDGVSVAQLRNWLRAAGFRRFMVQCSDPVQTDVYAVAVK